MSLVGTEFARSHMETKGWSSGEGLGRHGQGIVDAIKPKLKFDQAGMGHNRAEEFEFHWWDHVFNKAAKSIKVEDNEGEVTVDFNSDKSELSTKKLRKKAQKEAKTRLYSNFVKAGTMTGGKFDEEEGHENNFVEDTDLSKLKELTDEELVAACGGLTAHKGSRHGHNMQAKLDRIAEAEREYMENYNKRGKVAEEVKEKKKKKKSKRVEEEVLDVPSVSERLEVGDEESTDVKVKKKKRKRSHEEDTCIVEQNLAPLKKKKKHKKGETEEHDDVEVVKKKKKHKKSKS
eukprot:GFUD01039825.1.p1 GENE.GFUD01039825.1~~GFUD01039825.1.p1  ORF type:complete len:289 (-),score=102.62 GFUD01039825.1:113-979(-)